MDLPQKKQISIYVDYNTAQKLEELAKKEDRSVSKYLAILIKNKIKKEEKNGTIQKERSNKTD